VGEYENGTNISDASILLLNKTASGKGSYALNLMNFKGSYFFSITSLQKVNLTVVLLNKALTHLVPR